MKKTNTFMNDRKNYDKMRRLYRYLFLDGSGSKQEMLDLGIAGSERSLYDNLHRIRNYLGEHYLIRSSLPTHSGDRYCYHLYYDMIQCPLNYLNATYSHASFLTEDVVLYVTFLRMFGESYGELPPDYPHYEPEDCFTLNDLLIDIQGILSGSNWCTSISDIMIKRRLGEYVELGLLVRVSNDTISTETEILYRFVSDYWFETKISDDEWCLLKITNEFFEHGGYLSVPGFFLSQSMSLYLDTFGDNQSLQSMRMLPSNPCIQYRDNTPTAAVDNEILWQLLEAIHCRQTISYDYETTRTRLSDTILPIKIIVDQTYGRLYLFGYSYTEKGPLLRRLDYLYHIEESTIAVLDDYQNYEHLNQYYNKCMEHVWHLAFGKELLPVVVDFTYPIDKIEKSTSMVANDSHGGTIVPIDSTHFQYTNQTQNLYEVLPWIRQWGHHAKVNATLAPKLYEIMKNDIREVYQVYESI